MSHFLGLDVSKKTLDFALITAGTAVFQGQIPNEEKEVRKLLLHFKKEFSVPLADLVVCMEHTGIYNYKALSALHKVNVKVCLEPALQIKQSQGMTRGKNDKVDALRIGIYAYKNRETLTYWKPKREALQRLQVLLTTRDRLIKAKVQLEVPLEEYTGFVDKIIVKAAKLVNAGPIKSMIRAIEDISSQIEELISRDDKIKLQHELITSVPGVGTMTASNMIIATGEFEQIKEAKKFACYAGVAPFVHESGSSIRGKTRVSKLANMTMKRLLHLGAMSAIQFDAELKTYYQRKVNEGKNKMSVINAVRNKLISRVYVCIAQQRSYKKDYSPILA